MILSVVTVLVGLGTVATTFGHPASVEYAPELLIDGIDPRYVLVEALLAVLFISLALILGSVVD
jgi:hypothetical protein